MDKRGISAIIAIAVLIGFVIVTGGIVWIYIQKFSSERLEEVGSSEACSELNIEILEACYSVVNTGDDSIKVRIESKSSRIVDKGFLIRIFGDGEELIPSTPFTELQGFNIEDVVVFYDDSEVGAVKKVEVIPKVKLEDGRQLVCSLQSDTFNVIEC